MRGGEHQLRGNETFMFSLVVKKKKRGGGSKKSVVRVDLSIRSSSDSMQDLRKRKNE